MFRQTAEIDNRRQQFRMPCKNPPSGRDNGIDAVVSQRLFENVPSDQSRCADKQKFYDKATLSTDAIRIP